MPNPHLESLTRAQKALSEGDVKALKVLALEFLIMAAVFATDKAPADRKEQLLKQLRRYKAFLQAGNPCGITNEDLHDMECWCRSCTTP